MDTRTVGESALVGWRAKVGDRVADAIGERTRFDADRVRVAVGLAFLALSVWYVASTLARIARRG
jgi:hypothetical protein